MFRPQYNRIAESPKPSLIELTSAASAVERPSSRGADAVTLGQPQSKPYFDSLDLAAVLCSLACVAASIFVVTPHLTISWWLGFEDQLVVIGFLMSVMTLCVKRLAPTLFLILEAQWGSSNLQNYNAILTNSMWLSQTALLWRTTLFILVLLPLVLSAAYKQFTTGGTSTAVIQNRPAGHYGLVAAPLGNINTMNNSIYFMINANLPFMTASSNDSVLPPFADLPKAYGYNTLLLSNTSAALLDMPVPENVTSIQQSLKEYESWQISASVNAIVTKYNTSGEARNDTFWQNAFTRSKIWRYLGSFELYDADAGYNLGLLLPMDTGTDGAHCFIGDYKDKTNVHWLEFDRDYNSSNSRSFRSAAMMFNTRREKCTGTWRVTRSNISLVDGSCTDPLTNQSIMNGNQPYPMDALPVLYHSLGQYAITRKGSPWRLPAFTTSVATMHWARLIWKNQYQSSAFTSNSEIYYQPTDEVIVSTKLTMRDPWLLYLVLFIQPLLAIILFSLALLFYSTPIHKGFGLVAILAGINRDSLGSVQGAALSGKLVEPIRMNINVCPNVSPDHDAQAAGRIEYTLGRTQHKRTSLSHGKKYS
ncbi:hypothetical protein LPUS_11959 [Lasallia pustulata]|uniref:Uncharacterized protein n=1 Tax=Lasallia pustulata TaxID=136370 RepID=A0A1W5DDX3_9LECA|nr:hypothetical protein LPUS_11959 [Lasallia pustulata]